jgi:ankyrin repeat protein
LLGDAARVGDCIGRDPHCATGKGGPLQWDALTHLCFSKFLRLEPARTDGFLQAARALLDAGASANTGFFDRTHLPNPEWESALYGAAGVAHHAGLTRLLIERGADPNDEEVPYHSPETYDNDALRVLLESGRLSQDSLATMLLRKADWHDLDGMKLLLQHGASPSRWTRWRFTALHQAVRRDNALDLIEVLLDGGADPASANPDGHSPMSIAAWRGRGDVLELFETRGVPAVLAGVERLLAACARGDATLIGSMAADQPDLVRALLPHGGTALSQFAGVGNARGVACLLDLGIDVNARLTEPDPYYGIALDGTALHSAAWRGHPAVVKLLIARGANVNAIDDQQRTPLMLAVKASVDSYWTYRRTPESVEALLNAGASIDGVAFPSGYGDVDVLLRRRRDKEF